MLVGEERNKVDRIWDIFWTGGLTNPLLVIEQFTYLLFIKQLDDLEIANEANATLLGFENEDKIFGPDQQNYRWSKFKNLTPAVQFKLMRDEIFPFIKELNPNDDASYSRFMKDATFQISEPDKLARIIEGIDSLNLEDRDSKGDLYEYMLSKLASSKINGQFRTPRHIVKMMVEMVAPQPSDIIVDPAMGTAGFLVAAEEYIRDHHSEMLLDDEQAEHFNNTMFNGFDTDPTMLRIGTMNMMLHGVKNPCISNKDSLSRKNEDKDLFTLVLANPPFKGSLDNENVEESLLRVTKTKKTELLFLALFLRVLKLGGRAAVIVPDGVLFGSSKAHVAIRKELIENHKLTAVISMPGGVFKPYSGVSTAILFFTKTGVGGTDKVWFYDMKADGYSLDDKRQDIAENDIPDIIARYNNLEAEADRKRTDQSFLVPVEEIRNNKYELLFNRYNKTEYVPVEYPPTEEILDKIDALESEIQSELAALRKLLIN